MIPNKQPAGMVWLLVFRYIRQTGWKGRSVREEAGEMCRICFLK